MTAQPQPDLDWVQQGSGGSCDVVALRQAHEDFIASVGELSFGAPPVGEWDAYHVLAHVAAVDFSIASVALAVAAGQHPAYDNRTTLDPWHLRVLTERCPAINQLLNMVRTGGELLCMVAKRISSDALEYPLPTLIVSRDEAVLDATIPLRTLIEGVGRAHLPLHEQQLRALTSR
jgi:hypothetical protein